MRSEKIQSASVDLALNAAIDALSSDPELAWIGKSCIIERSYFLGLIKGLDAIAEGDSITPWIAKLFIRTMRNRSADDTFSATRLGKDFADLRDQIGGLDSEKTLNIKAIEKLLLDICGLDREWKSYVSKARELISEIQALDSQFELPSNGKTSDWMHDRMDVLEDLIRHISLLETHHEISKRIE
jgi:hypothetical protein